MRSFVEMMPCFQKFDRSNFACSLGCKAREECEEQTPAELLNAVTEIAPEEEMEPADDVLTVIEQELAGIQNLMSQAKQRAQRGKKKNDAPASRFDIIDISKEEK